MADDAFKYVFGPVLSRRLGRSLGVDVIPFKTCTYDCIYCQLGRTTHHTPEMREYVPLEDLLEEIRRKVSGGLSADYITIAGSGEPTLYSELGALIAGIKALASIPVAVITNGSLLWRTEVQDALLEADVVVPNLDAGDAESFVRVNRPCSGIEFEQMVEGLAGFRKRYAGQLWLEVFVLHGITDADTEIAKLAALIQRIRPDKVQLNTVERPAPDGVVQPVPRADLERIAMLLGANVEVIAHDATARHASGAAVGTEDILAVIKRHPCSVADLARGLGIHPQEAAKHIRLLLEQDAIYAEVRDGVVFYLARTQ